jgi:hypothetical protein
MSLSGFAASIQVESGEISQLAKALQHPQNPSHRQQDATEDVEMYAMPNASISRSELHGSVRENGVVDDPSPGQSTDHIQTTWEPYRNRFRVLAACLSSFANGMNDSAPGALIASIEKYDPLDAIFYSILIATETTT